MNPLNSTPNPLELLASNPNTKHIADMLRNGANPKELFYKLCRERGVNPDSILSMLQQRF